jgi:hypothetical protein
MAARSFAHGSGQGFHAGCWEQADANFVFEAFLNTLLGDRHAPERIACSGALDSEISNNGGLAW